MDCWKLTCSLFVEVKNMGLCSRSLLTFTVFTTFSFIPDLTNIHFQFTKSGISYNKQPILIINLSQGHKVEKLSDIVTYILIYFAFSGSKTGTKWILTEKKTALRVCPLVHFRLLLSLSDLFIWRMPLLDLLANAFILLKNPNGNFYALWFQK